MPISPTGEGLIFITMGDPAGVGPEIIAKAFESFCGKLPGRFVVVADSLIMKRMLSEETKEHFTFIPSESQDIPQEEGFYLIDPDESFSPPQNGPTGEGSRKAKKCLDSALDLLKSLPASSKAGLVTAPVSKYHISLVEPGFTGHTEYLRDFYSKEHVTMAMVGEHLKVVPLTRHLALRAVPGMIRREFLMRAIAQVIEFRKAIAGKDNPVIGVCALNPHAGEAGRLGTEEIDVVIPVLEELKEEYRLLTGPFPADVAFYKAICGEIDIVLGMYHDQCLGPFKMLDFDNGVNMTLGLDHVRTSPDHGTAFDIAGTGKASARSMINAVLLASSAINSY